MARQLEPLQVFGDYSMKKTQLALAAVALVASSAAMADGVTVSGRIDYGVTHASKADTVTGVQGGLLAPNFINVTGSEDIGGLKASFNWVNLVNNAGGLINANANVGVSTGAVGVKMGRVTDDFLTGVLAFDVTGGGNMGSAVSPILQMGATGAFHSNAVQVDGSAAGVNFGATYIGQNSSSTLAYDADTSSVLAGAYAGARGDYSVKANTDIGGIRIGAAYAKRSTAAASLNDQAVALTSKTHQFIGAGTNIGDLAVNLNYMKLNTTTVTGGNASYPLAGAITATAGYYNYSDTDTSADTNTGTLMSIGLKYAFSKRTTGFANYEKTSGGAVAMQGAVGYNGGKANGITILGLAHSF
jgi:predicted porin